MKAYRDQVARNAIGEQLEARGVGDRRVEPSSLPLLVILVDSDMLNIEIHSLPLTRRRVEVFLGGEARPW